MRRPIWMNEGACIGSSPELFFLEERRSGGSYAQGKSICAKCPVRRKCLEYALRNGEDEGLWGGKSPRERRALKTSLRREQYARSYKATQY